MHKWKILMVTVCACTCCGQADADVYDVGRLLSEFGDAEQRATGRQSVEGPAVQFGGAPQGPPAESTPPDTTNPNFFGTSNGAEAGPPSWSSRPAAAPTGPVKLNPEIYTSIVKLEPPPSPSPPTRAPPVATNPYRYHSSSTFGPEPQLSGTFGVAPKYTPGGISLSKAAAERMALNIDIDSLAYRDGQVVLSGAQNTTTRIDAALFLTALRLACDSYDPSFSLDPVDGAAWNSQGRDALNRIWGRIEKSYSRDPGASGFTIESFSVKRRYPSLWTEIEPRYPELRSRLVFRPAWLIETRFGEILYKADVLLKELTSGVSVLEPDGPLRANGIHGYVPSDQRGVARGLLIPDHLKESRGWRGYRLWFDLLPQADPDASASYQNPDSTIDRSKYRELYSTLRAAGFVGGPAPNAVQKATFSISDGVVDVSEVYPKMFVRRHDHVTGQDIGGADHDLDLLSGDVNERTAQYVDAYPELRDLTDVFRAYVASVKVVNAGICGSVLGLPLSEGEKVTGALPEFHPSELFITVAKYAWSEPGRRGWRITSGNSINGGIALRGKEFSNVASVVQETAIIREVKQTLSTGVPAPSWKDSSGRQYLAFNLDSREPVRRAPIVATAPGK